MTFIKYYIHQHFKMIGFWLALIMLLGMFLYGCSPADSELEAASTESEAKEITIDEKPQEKAVDQKETLRVGVCSLPENWSPFSEQTAEISNVLSLIFEPAVRIDAQGQTQPSIIENWTISEDEMTVTLQVRKNVSFHGDYGEVTADDIVFLIRELSNEENGAMISPYAKSIKSCKKIDDYTIEVALTKPTYDVFYFLNFPVVPKEYYEDVKEGIDSKPIGTGPYAVEAINQKKGSLSVNQEWWRTLPSFQNIEVILLENEQAKLDAMKAGEVDIIYSSSIQANRYQLEGKTNFYSVVTPYYDCLIPNFNKDSLSRQKVRQAISKAIDRKELISSALMGQAMMTETPLRPDFWYFQDSAMGIESKDIATASKLLEEEGYLLSDDGYRYRQNESGTRAKLSYTLIYTENTEFSYRKTVAEGISKQLKEIGIDVTIKALDAEEYKQALEQGNFDLALASWYMRENNDITFLFQQETNYGNCNVPDLEQTIAEANSHVVSDKLKAAQIQLMELLCNELPQIGLYYRTNSVISEKSISCAGSFRYQYAYADINTWEYTE